MSNSFKLGLPTDIPWSRRCVTEDMIDPVVCDRTAPPKWQSSIALFDYTPDDEYQQFPDYDITFLKATVTITGYQPASDEIQGQIDWDGVDVSVIDGVNEMLSTYYPCTGAILQLTVGPKGAKPNLDRDEYPFFMDFEPKKRELYEMATDTQERQSRSLEDVKIGRSSGSTQSTEVLDVDMGGSTSFGANASYAGTGGGFNFSSSNSGQWGTKSVNSDTSQASHTTQLAQERRETQSFTTHLSQMYHLLDSYHLGTNRAVFFVQPRPHVIEEPSGFVRGPRKVEGIQEFFAVVAKPKNTPDWCVAARLDTSHLVDTDIMDFEYRTMPSGIATAEARKPTRNDQPSGTTTREACFIGCWDVTYKCFSTADADDVIFQAPAGWEIISWTDSVNSSDGTGTSSVTISPDRSTLTVHAEATARICFEDSGVCVDCPDEVDYRNGRARRGVNVQLRSIERTRKVDTRRSLVITTRGLCCCDESPFRIPTGVIDVVDLPGNLQLGDLTVAGQSGGRWAASGMMAMQGRALIAGSAKAKSGDHGDCGCSEPPVPDAAAAARHALLIANETGGFVKERMARTLTGDALPKEPVSFIETDVFTRQVEAIALRSPAGRSYLDAKATGLDAETKKVLAKQTGKRASELRRRDVLRISATDLAREVGSTARIVGARKLTTLGIATKPVEKPAEKPAERPAKKAAKKAASKKTPRSKSAD